ncbi:hypothetical protein [Phage f2b1]|nr:hypothetical protein [Phage f2b1]
MTTINAYVDTKSLDKYIEGEYISAWATPGESSKTVIQMSFPLKELRGVEDYGKEGIELVFRKSQ